MAQTFDLNSQGLFVPSLNKAERKALMTIAYDLCGRVFTGTATPQDHQQLLELNDLLYGDVPAMKMEDDARNLSSRIVGAVTGDSKLVRHLQMPEVVWTTEDAIAASMGIEDANGEINICDAHGNVVATITQEEFLEQLELEEEGE